MIAKIIYYAQCSWLESDEIVQVAQGETLLRGFKLKHRVLVLAAEGIRIHQVPRDLQMHLANYHGPVTVPTFSCLQKVMKSILSSLFKNFHDLIVKVNTFGTFSHGFRVATGK